MIFESLRVKTLGLFLLEERLYSTHSILNETPKTCQTSYAGGCINDSGAGEMYRCVLFDSGREVGDAQNVNGVRKGVTPEKARGVLNQGGKLSLGEMVRLRVRYFSDGLVLGSREFVEEVFSENRDKFGPRRKNGARRLGESETPLYTLRRLSVRAMG